MSINQGQAPADPQQPSYPQQPPYPQEPYPQQPYEQPAAPAYGYMPPPPKKNGVAIWAIVLAILLPGIGFILSIIALVRSGQRGRRALSIVALVISVLLSSAYTFAIYKVATSNIATAIDPGCRAAITAVNDNNTRATSSDAVTAKQGLLATVDGLNSAISQSQHANVKQAVTTLRDDYTGMLNAVSGTAPVPPGLQDKLNTDTDAVNALCAVGGTSGS
jgi:hypothetical protein